MISHQIRKTKIPFTILSEKVTYSNRITVISIGSNDFIQNPKNLHDFSIDIVYFM